MVYIGSGDLKEDKEIHTGLSTCCLILMKEKNSDIISAAHPSIPLNFDKEYTQNRVLGIKDAFDSLIKRYSSRGVKLDNLGVVLAGCRGDDYLGLKNYSESLRIAYEKNLNLVNNLLIGLPCDIDIEADSKLVKALLYFDDRIKKVNFKW